MIKIKIKKLYLNTVLPKKSSEHAACYDVVAREIIKKNDNLVTVKLGFATDIPNGYKGVIVPRSSFTHKGWVMQNSPGQVDSDYRGEWMIKYEAIPHTILYKMDMHGKGQLRYPDFPYKVGDRCAQIFFEKVENIYWEETETLNNTVRNNGGFGSTGK